MVHPSSATRRTGALGRGDRVMSVRLQAGDKAIASFIVKSAEAKNATRVLFGAKALAGNDTARREFARGDFPEPRASVKWESGDLEIARLALRACAAEEGELVMICAKALQGQERAREEALKHVASAKMGLAPREGRTPKKEKSAKKAKGKSATAKAIEAMQARLDVAEAAAKKAVAQVEAKVKKAATKAAKVATPKKAKKAKKAKAAKTVAATPAAKKTAKKSKKGGVSKAEFLARMAAGRAAKAAEGGGKTPKKTAKRGKKTAKKKAKKTAKKSSKKSKAQAVAEKAGEMLAATAHAVVEVTKRVMKGKPSAALLKELEEAKALNKQLKELAAERKLNERLKKEATKKGGATSPAVKKIEEELQRVQKAEEKEIAKAEKAGMSPVDLEDPIPVGDRRVLVTPSPAFQAKASSHFAKQKAKNEAARLEAMKRGREAAKAKREAAAAKEEETPPTQRTPSVRGPATQRGAGPRLEAVPKGTAKGKRPSGAARRKAAEQRLRIAGPQSLGGNKDPWGGL